ncbi:hypothetical protein [Vibrio phage vB_VhaS-a]|nr:hypothetical protein [Vibrio phage vB_VhaS-a]
MNKPFSAPPPRPNRNKGASIVPPTVEENKPIAGNESAHVAGGRTLPFEPDTYITVKANSGSARFPSVKLIARKPEPIKIGTRYGHYIVTGKSDIDSDGREYVCRCVCEDSDTLYCLPESELQARPTCDHFNGSFERPDYIPFTRHMINRYKELIELYDVTEEFNTFEKFCTWWVSCGTTERKALVNIKPHERAHPDNMRFMSPHLVGRYRELAAIRCVFFTSESFLSLALEEFASLKRINKELSYKKYDNKPELVELAIVKRRLKETF